MFHLEYAIFLGVRRVVEDYSNAAAPRRYINDAQLITKYTRLLSKLEVEYPVNGWVKIKNFNTAMYLD